MTDIDAKALALVREVLAERNLSDKRAVRREVSPYTEALCRAIEQHEAFKQEVSDTVHAFVYESGTTDAWEKLNSFIIPKPKPDPIAEAWIEATGNTVGMGPLNAALEARGLEIREKGQ